jgi:hypothetical protein
MGLAGGGILYLNSKDITPQSPSWLCGFFITRGFREVRKFS